VASFDGKIASLATCHKIVYSCVIIIIIVINVVWCPIYSSETDSALQCLDDFRKQVFRAFWQAGADWRFLMWGGL